MLKKQVNFIVDSQGNRIAAVVPIDIYDEIMTLQKALLTNKPGERELYRFMVKSVGGGLFRVQVDGMYGYINARGSLIVEPRCKYGKEFSEGFALVLNDENEVNILNESGVSVARLGSVYGFLDASVFSEGLVCFKHQDRFVFINSCGVQPFGESFEGARGFSCGLACVKKDGLWGYVNKFGDWVIPNIYESAFCFEDGIAIVKSKLGFGLIDLRGKFVMNPNYTFILWAQNGHGIVKVEVDPFYDDPVRNKIMHPNGGVAESYRYDILYIGTNFDAPNIQLAKIKDHEEVRGIQWGLRDPFTGRWGNENMSFDEDAAVYHRMWWGGVFILDATRTMSLIPNLLRG